MSVHAYTPDLHDLRQFSELHLLRLAAVSSIFEADSENFVDIERCVLSHSAIGEVS
jgi:hypothetical protein